MVLMMAGNPLKPDTLGNSCSPKDFDFETTDDLESPEDFTEKPRVPGRLCYVRR